MGEREPRDGPEVMLSWMNGRLQPGCCCGCRQGSTWPAVLCAAVSPRVCRQCVHPGIVSSQGAGWFSHLVVIFGISEGFAVLRWDKQLPFFP